MRKQGILFIAKEPILTTSQVEKLADVFIAFGQLSAASMVIPFLLPDVDQSRLFMILLGILLTIGAWSSSVLIVRRIE